MRTTKLAPPTIEALGLTTYLRELADTIESGEMTVTGYVDQCGYTTMTLKTAETVLTLNIENSSQLRRVEDYSGETKGSL